MEKDTIIERIRVIAAKYITDWDIADDTPLTSRPYYAGSLSIAAIFLCIEQEFEVDLNKVFERHMDYSVKSIADAVRACI